MSVFTYTRSDLLAHFRKVGWMLRILCILLCAVIKVASATNSGNGQIINSAIRAPNETYEQAAARYQHSIEQANLKTVDSGDSPFKLQNDLSQLDFSQVPQVANYNELLSIFYAIRDTRFLYPTDTHMPIDFIRRISWMNPYDGCYSRAAAAGNYLSQHNLTRPHKIFAFGDLKTKSKYGRYDGGYIEWWFHVSSVLGVNGVYYVLDPSVDDSRPLLVEEWLKRISIDTSLDKMKGIICNAYTYDQSDSCYEATTTSDDKGIIQQKEWLLDGEHENVEGLGMDPYKVLGDTPPWAIL